MNNKLLKVVVIISVLFGVVMLVLAVYFYAFSKFQSENNTKEGGSAVLEESKGTGEGDGSVSDKTEEPLVVLPPAEEPPVVLPPADEPPVEEPPVEEPPIVVEPADEIPTDVGEPVIRNVYIKSYSKLEGFSSKPAFSTKGFTVHKGDVIRLSVDVTLGSHNFNIDEYDIHEETPTGEITVIEFVADKTGDFVFYCSKPGHRSAGQWGTMRVE
ncbi:MAG: hypothetical protein Q8O88_01925 [bacterium]|nr:hypothetical protein [bacterium]